MRRLRTLLPVAAACGVLWTGSQPAAQTASPFAFFDPLVALTPDDRAGLDAGRAIVKVLPHGDRELAIFSAVRTDVPGSRLAAWVRVIEELKRSRHVSAIARFSTPPRIEDLAMLDLDDDDLNALRRCRPGSCGVKLSAAEIQTMQQAIGRAGGRWRSAAQEAFRRMLLDRALRYGTGGLEGAPPYHDQRSPTPLAPEFQALVDSSPYLSAHAPELVAHFDRYPRPGDAIESFLYWSKETLGGKPIVALTHVAIVAPGGGHRPEVLVASRQFYASHYMTGALALTAIVGGGEGQPRYLAYLNRSRVDVLGGLFGGFARRIIERRLRGEATEVVEALRRRLESGDVPRLTDG